MSKKEPVKRTEEKISMHLPVKLTEVELLEISREMSLAHREIERIDQNEKSVRAQFKAEREMAQGKLSRCSNLIETGIEHRSVTCTKVKDWNERIVYVQRDDTLAQVQCRDMTQEEAQMELDGVK
jgi:hypothetical protein